MLSKRYGAAAIAGAAAVASRHCTDSRAIKFQGGGVRELNEFLEFVAKYFPVAVFLIGLLTFFYREKVKQILSKVVLEDVERLKGRSRRIWPATRQPCTASSRRTRFR